MSEYEAAFHRVNLIRSRAGFAASPNIVLDLMGSSEGKINVERGTKGDRVCESRNEVGWLAFI
jgi:hypothetical protein